MIVMTMVSIIDGSSIMEVIKSQTKHITKHFKREKLRGEYPDDMCSVNFECY